MATRKGIMAAVRSVCYIYSYNNRRIMSASAGSAHSPTLDTIKMVEDFIREHSGEYRRRALWERLPRKVMYQTFKTIIEYLQESNKIAIDARGKVCWIHDPDLVRWYLAREDLRIR